MRPSAVAGCDDSASASPSSGARASMSLLSSTMCGSGSAPLRTLPACDTALVSRNHRPGRCRMCAVTPKRLAASQCGRCDQSQHTALGRGNGRMVGSRLATSAASTRTATSSSSTANRPHSGRVTTVHDAIGEKVDAAIVLDVGTKATSEQLQAFCCAWHRGRDRTGCGFVRNLTPLCTREQPKVSISPGSRCAPPHRRGDVVGPAYNGADPLPRHNGVW
jgi:hypothetical protein